MSMIVKQEGTMGEEIHQTLIGNITTCLCNKVHTSPKPMSITSALAFSIEISDQWRLIIFWIPSGPQVVEILPRGKKLCT